MRQITRDAVNAFNAGHSFVRSNTEVKVFGTGARKVVSLYLHGNEIARKDDMGTMITNAGWFSNTTKERLNALDGVDIRQEDFVWYLNDKEWDGKWAVVDGDMNRLKPKPRYKIVRFYKNGEQDVIDTGFSLKDAQAWCRDPDTHKVNKDGTVEWFDGYTEE